jgi:hypothetical protein
MTLRATGAGIISTRLGLIDVAPFNVVEVEDTPVNRFEFSAVIEATSSPRT